MNRRSGFNLFPILMLAALLLGYGSQRPIRSAQTAPPPQPPPSANREPAQKPAGPGTLGGGRYGVEILSDTQGVDFVPYLRKMVMLLQKNWEAIMPKAVRMGEKGRAWVLFTILPDGTLSTDGPKIEAGSGRSELDNAALKAINNSVPFEKLPGQFHGPCLKLRVIFLYNMQPSPELLKTPAEKE